MAARAKGPSAGRGVGVGGVEVGGAERLHVGVLERAIEWRGRERIGEGAAKAVPIITAGGVRGAGRN